MIFGKNQNSAVERELRSDLVSFLFFLNLNEESDNQIS